MVSRTFGKYPAAILLIILVIPCFSCSKKRLGEGSPYSEIISRDTTWSGEVFVDGVVLVRKGASLHIAPGTTIKFSKKRYVTEDEHEGFVGSGIKIEGRINAGGTKEDPIFFTSMEPDGPGSWDRLYFVFSKGSLLKHCVIEYGGYAIHSHFSQISISSSLFRRNIEGVRLGGSNVTIKDSVFTGNRVRGINFKDSRNVITGCAVYNNGVGIFLHSKNSQSAIRENAIYNNKRYDLRLGDLHREHIDATRNWWGSNDLSYVKGRVYDGEDQDGLGKANILPFLRTPSVTVSGVKGFLISGKKRSRGKVYAIKNLQDGFSDSRAVSGADTDKMGAFDLKIPPGRYFIYARSGDSKERLFGFTGNNPMILEPFDERLLVIPLVLRETKEPDMDCSEGGFSGMRVTVTREGKTVTGAFVYLYDEDALDIRGPGIASGVTSSEGMVDFKIPPGGYIVAVRKRSGGGSLGTVDYGGYFGISSQIPVRVNDGCLTNLSVPVFVKEGIIAEEDAEESLVPEGKLRAQAFLTGSSAGGYMVYFYRTRKPVGRPEFVSAVVGRDGSFSIDRVEAVRDGTYYAFLRKASSGTAGSSEVITAGPLEVHIGKGVITPSLLEF